LKLASLLAQFLYENKRLDLPGVGTFTIDSTIITENDSLRVGKSISAEAIHFENNFSIKESPDLIQFISTATGKMKALAAADLDSHLSLVLQFLNIGKPFLLEGIGSLVKNKSGEFAFTPGLTLPEKIKEIAGKDLSGAEASEESLADYKSIFYKTGTKKISLRKPALIFLIGAGIALAVWSGYKVYKKTTGNNKSETNGEKSEEETAAGDTVTLKKYRSISVQNTSVANIPPGTYKFILEIAGSKRAFDRYNKLKTFQWSVQMETKDSVSYKLFMLLPASAVDTSRIIDSLSILNGRRVYIEQ
jgi:hypothetical protein